jgi:1-acyl-sn-glycerol-3-phosphate acyltransferase
VLRDGGLLALFPEGTRVRDPDRLGEPRRGAARLALESGATIVPAAISGTEDLWLGPLPKPRRVQVAFSAAVPVDRLPATPEGAERLTDAQVWPEVERSYRALRSRRTAAAALLAALGLGGGLAYRRSRRPPPSRIQRVRRRLPGGRR